MEMLANMAIEIHDIGQVISPISGGNYQGLQPQLSLDMNIKTEKLEEEFMVTKLQIARLKSDIRNVVQVRKV